MEKCKKDASGAQSTKKTKGGTPRTTERAEVEEYFNSQFETIAVALHRAGLEYDHDGNLVKFDTPFAMGAKQGGENIAKQLK